jgi:uncharacterized OB-fold protein
MTTVPAMSARVPVVEYLALDPEPHLVAQECTSCGARFYGRRNACAACGHTEFEAKPAPGTGTLESFTIVHRGAPKKIGPFVAAVVRLDDNSYIKANLLGVAPEPEAITLGAPVQMTTFVAGTDDDGNEAVSFGYTPAQEQ